MSVQWDTVHIPFGRGVSTRVDDRALEPPSMAVLQNAEFEQLGGFQKRKPFTSLVSAPSDVRRIVPYEDELIVFTSDEIRTYDASSGTLRSRGTYFAPKVDERSVFTAANTQTLCERAELDGVVVYAWVEEVASSFEVMVAAVDKSTKATIVEPTSRGANTTWPRLIALTNVILLLYSAGTALQVRVIDPTTVVTDIPAAGSTITSAFNGYVSIAQKTSITAVIAYRASATSYLILRVLDETGATIDSYVTSRTINGPSAIAVAPSGDICVCRTNGTSLYGDIYDFALDNVFGNVLLGVAASAVDQVTCAFFSDLVAGEYRAQVFISVDEGITGSRVLQNWIDVTGAKGSTGSFVALLTGLGSQAFEYNGTVMAWMAFEADGSGAYDRSVQNSYLLMDAGANLYAKSVPQIGGGYSRLRGHVPNIQALSATQFALCLVERRIIPSSQRVVYAQRSPREVILTFDSNDARRCVQLGKTLYVSGSQVMQYDGARIAELGFSVYPFELTAADSGVAGALSAGTYVFTATLRWENARGELERSTGMTYFDANIASSRKAQIYAVPVPISGKGSDAAYELWRSVADPSVDSPYYLITSKDPTDTGDNGYIENNRALAIFPSFLDNLSDNSLTQREIHPENGAVLENIAPPSATIIAAGQDRLFLAGIPGEPYRVVYSKLRGLGELAAFHDSLYLDLPPDAGAITGLRVLNETPIAFCEHGIYALPGLGLDNLGQGDNYYARVVSTDIGAVSSDAIGVTADGIVFQSLKGWHMLDRGMNVRYIGADVAAFDGYTFSAVNVVDSQHQVRCFGTSGSAAMLLVFDTVAQAWSEWTLDAASVHAAWYQGAQVVATDDAILSQESAHGASGYDYYLDVETPWIKLSDLQGFRRIRRFVILGEYRSAHRLRVRVAYDYDDSSWAEDTLWTVSPTTVGGPLQLAIRPARQKGQAIKIRLTDQHASTSNPPPGEALKLTGLALEVGRKRGAYRLPAAQKQ